MVLTLQNVRVYKDEKQIELKGELTVDEKTRVLFLEQPVNNSYRFAIVNLKECLEFGVQDIDIRNMWLQKLVHLAEQKSELGGHVMRVGSEADYRNVVQWENAVVADSIDKSTGVLVFQSVKSEVFDEHSRPVEQKHLSVVKKPDPHFASFVPFDNWQETFEPEVRAAMLQAQKNEELRRQGYKTPDPTARERVRDYMVDSIVTNITTSSTQGFCTSLLEGIVEVIAASERQLARKYHLASAAKNKLAVVSSTDKPNEAFNSVGQSLPKEAPPIAGSVRDIKDASLLVMTEPPSEDVHLPIEEEDIPLPVQADLLCALGSLRGLVLTYRFDSTANEAQLKFTRRLTVHQLERSLSKVLQALEDFQKEEFEKASHAVIDAVGKTSARAAVQKVEKKLADKAVDKLDTVTAKMITPAPTDEKKDGRGEGEDHGEKKEAAEGNDKGQKEANGGEKNQDQDQQGDSKKDGSPETPKSPTSLEDAPSESDTPYERGIKLRRASLKQLRRILRPLLSRDFLRMEAAPLLQDFMKRNDANIHEFAGLAAEVTATFGDAMQKFIEKKTMEVEEMVVAQLESFMGVISEYSEHVPTSDELAEKVKTTVKEKVGEAASKLDDPALQNQPAPAFPRTSREVMLRLAQEKAAMERQIAQIKTEGSVLWDGSDKSLVEMVLLEKTDALWVQLQDAVRLCINRGLYALLDLTGAGLSTPPGQHFTATNLTSDAPSPPHPAPAAAPSSGYFF